MPYLPHLQVETFFDVDDEWLLSVSRQWTMAMTGPAFIIFVFLFYFCFDLRLSTYLQVCAMHRVY